MDIQGNVVHNPRPATRVGDVFTAGRSETAPFTMDMRAVSTNDEELVLQSLGTLIASTVSYKC